MDKSTKKLLLLRQLITCQNTYDRVIQKDKNICDLQEAHVAFAEGNNRCNIPKTKKHTSVYKISFSLI